MRLGGGTEKKLVANMGGARGETDWKPYVTHSCFECHDRDEVDEIMDLRALSRPPPSRGNFTPEIEYPAQINFLMGIS